MTSFKTALAWTTIFTLTACSNLPAKKTKNLFQPEVYSGRIEITSNSPLFKANSDQVNLGGLSDLVYDAKASSPSEWVFYSMTDRGPNGKPVGPKKEALRPFLTPAFSPTILKIVYKKHEGTAQVVESIPLQKPDGIPASGLPLPKAEQGSADEVAVDVQKKQLGIDPWGLDPEGLAKDADGSFWLAEEYGPSLLKISSSGQILNRWSARDVPSTLPSFLTGRKINRGFEALTWTKDGNLLLFLQSEIPNLNSVQKGPDFAPVVEFDPRTQKTVGLYFYPLSMEGGKIGAATLSADGEIFVLEQNGKTGGKAWQKIFRLQTSELRNYLSEKSLSDRRWKIPKKIQDDTKTEIVDLSSLGLNEFEKLEGLAIGLDGEFLIVNDNDFGVNPENAVNNYLFVLPRKTP